MLEKVVLLVRCSWSCKILGFRYNDFILFVVFHWSFMPESSILPQDLLSTLYELASHYAPLEHGAPLADFIVAVEAYLTQGLSVQLTKIIELWKYVHVLSGRSVSDLPSLDTFLHLVVYLRSLVLYDFFSGLLDIPGPTKATAAALAEDLPLEEQEVRKGFILTFQQYDCGHRGDRVAFYLVAEMTQKVITKHPLATITDLNHSAAQHLQRLEMLSCPDAATYLQAIRGQLSVVCPQL